MKGRTINLAQDWVIGDRIDGGGFGQVYEANSGSEAAVAKFVPKQPGADRELLFADGHGARNVVPVLDKGEHEDFWVLVMPRADYSLRAHVDGSGGSLALDEALTILGDVATALEDLAAQAAPVVHRDLKPENVLLLNGQWCLADFGISRYAEASTASDTHKFSMTPQYAAPEQWTYERASAATDVYAWGVIAYELVHGNRPFAGPGIEDLREQHLQAVPPRLNGLPPALSSLIDECLTKVPAGRPTAANLTIRLKRISQPDNPAVAALREAHAAATRQAAEAAAAAEIARSATQVRDSLYEVARARLDGLTQELLDVIEDGAPSAVIRRKQSGEVSVTLSHATLTIGECRQHGGGWSREHGAVSPIDVIAYTSMSLRNASPSYGYSGREHSLWFCDARSTNDYGWYETAFMELFAGPSTVAPASASPFSSEAAEAIGPWMGGYQVAWPFTRLDIGAADDWITRWSTWFSQAALGALHRPGTMPERSIENAWRR